MGLTAPVTAFDQATAVRPAGDGRWELAATPPISTYLFTLVAGPYHSIRTEHRGIPFGLHARQEGEASASVTVVLPADAQLFFDGELTQ